MCLACTRGWQALFADAQVTCNLVIVVLLGFDVLAGFAAALRFFELSS